MGKVERVQSQIYAGAGSEANHAVPELPGAGRRARRPASLRHHLAACAACLWVASSGADDASLRVTVPHLKAAGQEDYRRFAASEPHRAFAIAPGGAWAWVADAHSGEDALAAALGSCRRNTRQKCVPYAVDDRIVFDAAAWPTLWGPYKGREEARRGAVGTVPGNRFHHLAFKDAAGVRKSLGDFAGRVVVLHFWGSWCGPCRHEMPDLQALRASLRDRSDIVFVLLQAREPFETARRWAAEQKLNLPLYDSGSGGESDAFLRLAGGGRIEDREIAAQFPTTYVIDKHGVVLFSHVGPVPRWAEYADFLRDAANRSGR